MFPRSFVRNPTIWGANLAAAFSMAGFVSFLFAQTFFLQRGSGFSAAAAGLLLLPTALPFIAGTLLAGKIASVVGPRTTVLAGSVLMAGGFLLLAVGGASFSWGLFLTASTLIGCFGLAMPILFQLGVAGVDPGDRGVASGLLSASQQIGAGVGLALTAALTSTPQDAFWMCAGFLVLAGLVFGWLRQKSSVPVS
jgi:predicted MFS family arabinose efflux permease